MSETNGHTNKTGNEELEKLRRQLEKLERENEDVRRRNSELVVENTMLRRELRLEPSRNKHGAPSLMIAFEEILRDWRPCFRQERVYARARDLAMGFVLNVGRNTITGSLCALGRQFEDWTAYYRVFSSARYDPGELFGPLLHRCGGYLSEVEFFPVALDDSSVRKRGKRIKAGRVMREPLSLPYHVNLDRRLRFIQAAALICPDGKRKPSRAIPIGFRNAPSVRRPGRRSSPKVFRFSGIR